MIQIRIFPDRIRIFGRSGSGLRKKSSIRNKKTGSETLLGASALFWKKAWLVTYAIFTDRLGNIIKYGYATLAGISASSLNSPVPGTGLEECVVGVEYLPADDDVPLPQQSARILPFLTWGEREHPKDIVQSCRNSHMLKAWQFLVPINIYKKLLWSFRHLGAFGECDVFIKN